LGEEGMQPDAKTAAAQDKPSAAAHQVKGTAVCSHCGNEADMWIDL
jgi:hypothetical protein